MKLALNFELSAPYHPMLEFNESIRISKYRQYFFRFKMLSSAGGIAKVGF